MMKKNLFMLLIFIMGFTNLMAQSNFKQAYYISLQGDTIQGWIDFSTDYQNAISCKFKKSTEDSISTFYPGEIRSFVFPGEGKYYITKNVNVEETKMNLFLEYLVDGEMDLFYLYYNYKIYYFLENKQNELVKLEKKPDQIIESKIYKDLKYTGALSYAFKNYLPIAQNTSHIEFNKSSLIRITTDYHDKTCTSGEKCIVFQNDYKRTFHIVKWSAYTGIQTNSIDLYYINAFTMYSISPVIGIGIEYINPRISNAISTTGNLEFSSLNAKREFITQNERDYYTIQLNNLLTRLRFGFKYKFIQKPWKPFLEMGISAGIFLQNKSIYSIELPVGDFTERITKNDKVLPTNKILTAYGSIGTDIPLQQEGKSVNIRLTYSGFSTNNNLQALQLTTSYVF